MRFERLVQIWQDVGTLSRQVSYQISASTFYEDLTPNAAVYCIKGDIVLRMTELAQSALKCAIKLVPVSMTLQLDG